MPIKCAGAPQKAMYLSADHWRRTGRLKNIQVRFCSAGNTLFGVEAFVPPLMHYIRRYDIDLQLGTNLVSVDGPRRAARFSRVAPNGRRETIDAEFELLHVAPPQRAPDFVGVSPLADSSGWLDVDHFTLRHKRFANVFGLGDVTATPNAKTAAAVRKQAPVVAHNLLVDLGFARRVAKYDGYGSCPLTVEHGKILLAEFGYGGVLKPSLPRWIIDGQKPSRNAWRLKERVLPQLYWHGMLRGREWLARPRPSD
jgi:sulfide:quinone oxidoreductase